MKTTIFISGQKCEHLGFVLCLVFLPVLVLLIRSFKMRILYVLLDFSQKYFFVD